LSPAAKKPRRKPTKTIGGAPDKVLVLRSCRPDGRCCMQGHAGGDFVWPKAGPVSCDDFKPSPTCGRGLHGLLWGEGNGQLLDWRPDAVWLVVEVLASEIVQITEDGGGKVKFPRGDVVFFGKPDDAVAYLQARAPAGKAITKGTATAGDRGTATAGDRGTATAGDRGTATAGDRGTATAGDSGTATAGDRGTAKTGDLGVVAIRWWDRKAADGAGRFRVAIGYVGEDVIKPNTFYVVDEAGKLIEKAS
jgi:hypothetical protein